MLEAGKMREVERRRIVVVENGSGGLMVRDALAVTTMQWAQQQQRLVQLVVTLSPREGQGRKWKRMRRMPRGMSRIDINAD